MGAHAQTIEVRTARAGIPRAEYHVLVTHAVPDPGTPYAAALAVRRLDRWLKDRPIGEPVTLLDTGLGSCNACADLLRAARTRGHALRVVTIVEPGAPDPEIPNDLEAMELVRADPFALVEQFGPGSFDFVLTQFRVANLREVPRLTWLRVVDRLALSGVVWIERAGSQGLTKQRILDMIERVGASYLQVGRPLASPYFVIRGLKPVAGS